jgi:hypothetical protein
MLELLPGYSSPTNQGNRAMRAENGETLIQPNSKHDSEENQLPIYQMRLSDVKDHHVDRIKLLEEGWFIEFKSSFTDTAKIAKSLSSFANAYGGIIIVGIEEAPKGRKFGSFSPMSKDGAEETILRFRHAAESHLQPCPFFECKILNISEEDTLDSEKKCLVLAKIPKGEKPPYLHSSGVIYTRKGDSSSPVALTDLGLMERLWSNSTIKTVEMERRINFLCDQLSSNIPRLDIFIARKGHPKSELKNTNLDDFINVATQPTHPGNPPLFDNFYPIGSSFAARRTEGDPTQSGIIWEFDWFRSLHHIQIPLACHIWDEGQLQANHGGNERLADLEHFLRGKEELAEKKLFIVDLTLSMFIMSAVFYMVWKLHRNIGDDVELSINIKASSLKNVVVHAGLPRYMGHLETMGIPFIHRDIGFITSSMNPEDWMDFIAPKDDFALPDGVHLDMPNTFTSFIQVAQSLGISSNILLGDYDLSSEKIELGDLYSAFNLIMKKSFSFTCLPNPST